VEDSVGSSGSGWISSLPRSHLVFAGARLAPPGEFLRRHDYFFFPDPVPVFPSLVNAVQGVVCRPRLDGEADAVGRFASGAFQKLKRRECDQHRKRMVVFLRREAQKECTGYGARREGRWRQRRWHHTHARTQPREGGKRKAGLKRPGNRSREGLGTKAHDRQIRRERNGDKGGSETLRRGGRRDSTESEG